MNKYGRKNIKTFHSLTTSSILRNVEEVLECVPTHVGLRGKEYVDKLAKLGLTHSRANLNPAHLLT